MTHELRNTREAIDEEPKTTVGAISGPEAADHFLPPRACADLIEHALPDLRRARDRIQYVPRNRQLSRIVAELEDVMMGMRTERHY